jgi:hypothetical protein
LDEKVFDVMILLKNCYDAESRFQDKSWMYSIDREEVTAASSSVSNERMLEVESEVNQHHEEEIHLRDTQIHICTTMKNMYMYSSSRPYYF